MEFEVGQYVVFKENVGPSLVDALGVVTRVWDNKARYLTIVTDARTFVRCASDVLPAECGEHCSCDDCVPW